MAEQEEAAVELPGGTKVSAKGHGILAVATLIVCVCGFFFLWQILEAHARDARDEGNKQVVATNDNTRATRELAGEMRVQNCFTALTPEQKKAQETIAFCKSLAAVR